MKPGENWNFRQWVREMFCIHKYIALKLVHYTKGIWDFECIKCGKYHDGDYR